MLAFAMLVPWLHVQDADATLRGRLLGAWAMSVAYAAAVFGWFGGAIGRYTGWGEPAGVAVLLVAAPLFQPQFLVAALVRHAAGLRHGPALRAVAFASAWVASEALLPKLLDDTLGHALQPSRLLRQGAEVGGAAGLTFLLLLANEGLAESLSRWRGAGPHAARPVRAHDAGAPPTLSGARRHGQDAAPASAFRHRLAMTLPAWLAALVPLVLAAHGAAALRALPAPAGPSLRVGLVQANLADYEGRRREQGAQAVVREVLDTHFAMSWDAVERQGAQAVLWSETVYPTTFGQPKSEAGAEFDREIVETLSAAGVPFVFGSYERDAAGEYNAAVFLAAGGERIGAYRKTRVFPMTEHVPAWLDRPGLRRWLPWAGTWQPGSGARVFPLRLADGREVPVLPLICLDDMDAQLAVDGARLGAQAIVTLSNDAWFAGDGQGARLHHAAATFRSIETRLPQFRVTTTGLSAVIDPRGDMVAGAGVGERTLVVAEAPVGEPPRTQMVAWGDWVGRAGAAFLALLAAAAAWRRWDARAAADAARDAAPPALPADVAVLPPAARMAAGVLRALARGGLLAMGAAVLFGDALHANPLTQLRVFAALVVAPEAAAWCVLRAYSARAFVEQGALVLAHRGRRLAIRLSDIASAAAWRMPMPGPGMTLRTMSGERWDLAVSDPVGVGRRLASASASAAGGAADAAPDASFGDATSVAGVAAGVASGAAGVAGRDSSPRPAPAVDADAYAEARGLVRRTWADRPCFKFGVFPLLLAVPAFRLHQHIAYGSAFGEYLTFGAKAYATAFALWWAQWAMGVAVCAALLRAATEAGALAAASRGSLSKAVAARRSLERLGRAVLYFGLPALLLWRLLGN